IRAAEQRARFEVAPRARGGEGAPRGQGPLAKKALRSCDPRGRGRRRSAVSGRRRRSVVGGRRSVVAAAARGETRSVLLEVERGLGSSRARGGRQARRPKASPTPSVSGRSHPTAFRSHG